MKITIFCSSKDHPVNDYLQEWIARNEAEHEIVLVRKRSDLPGGDILFLISCSEIIRGIDRALYRKSLVVHASAVPIGRGWSPHVWQVIQGATELTITLLEAEDRVDTGAIWRQERIAIPKHALWDEINASVFGAELRLMDFATKNIETVKPTAQDKSVEPTYFPRRTAAHSQLDVHDSIANQFDLLRVCDPNLYPAYFEMHGQKYKIRLEKIDD